MTLSTLLALLQGVVLLLATTLANPNATQQDRSQAFVLAQTVVSLAAQSVSSSTTATLPAPVAPGSTPIAIYTPPPSPTPAPTRTATPAQAAAQPFCTLTGTLSGVANPFNGGGAITFDWQLNGASGAGQLYAWKPDAPNNPTRPWWPTPFSLTDYSRGSVSSGLGASNGFKAVFGGITCYAFFHDQYQSTSAPYFFNGATSSPTPLEPYQQSLVQ